MTGIPFEMSKAEADQQFERLFESGGAKMAKRAEEVREYPDPDVCMSDGLPGQGHVTDGSPCWCGPVTETVGGFEILPDEPESRPAPPARGKYPRLLQSLLEKGLAPGKPAMSIRVPESEEPLLVAEGLKREGRRIGQKEGAFWGEPARWGQWYVEAWVHPTKDRIVQVLAKEGVAPYTKKPKGEVQ